MMARNTRLVATGFLRTKSRLPVSMQQKCCDHGRSSELLTITWPILRARRACGSGGVPRKASILCSANSSIGLTRLCRARPDQGYRLGVESHRSIRDLKGRKVGVQGWGQAPHEFLTSMAECPHAQTVR